ncbi:MAG: hypothetical protein EHM22_06580 [Actinobacteria bacterium]|nr:MAG: hypothetical protein EHM22_06580 [Actinomycetota bacterium]
MPDHRVRTRSSPGPGGRTSTGWISTRRGATNRSARPSMGLEGTRGQPWPTAFAIAERSGDCGSTRMGTGLLVPETALVPEEIASLTLPSPFGEWETHAFEWEGSVHLCLCRGTIGDGEDVLVRMHSECVTGDSLGSLRCDCRTQLQHAFRAIAAEGRGVLVYSTGHEGAGSASPTSSARTCCRTRGSTRRRRTSTSASASTSGPTATSRRACEPWASARFD